MITVRFDTYDEPSLCCIRLVAKRKFMHDLMVETDARAIAMRFYPIGGDTEALR